MPNVRFHWKFLGAREGLPVLTVAGGNLRSPQSMDLRQHWQKVQADVVEDRTGPSV